MATPRSSAVGRKEVPTPVHLAYGQRAAFEYPSAYRSSRVGLLEGMKPGMQDCRVAWSGTAF